MKRTNSDDQENSYKKFKSETTKLLINNEKIEIAEEILTGPICKDKTHFFTALFSGNFDIEFDEIERDFIKIGIPSVSTDIINILFKYLQDQTNLSIFIDDLNRKALIKCAKFFAFDDLASLLSNYDIHFDHYKSGNFLFCRNERCELDDKTRNIKTNMSTQSVLFPVGTQHGSYELKYFVHSYPDTYKKSAKIGIYLIQDSRNFVSLVDTSTKENQYKIYQFTNYCCGLSLEFSDSGLLKHHIKNVSPDVVVEGADIEDPSYRQKYQYDFKFKVELEKNTNFIITIDRKQFTFHGVFSPSRLCITMTGVIDINKI